ncbi:DUF1295 domain-containing protein [Rhodococcus sp. BP-252]|uniref:DUF1295 domain-containing protein n=1 Tax=unclassified Rhodococcus (in: high G+C Gram-positive bacteria) TaxID=192944 RepID=UPI001C9B34FC|nr:MULTISPECIES: DUF1295 domain-containing protein [unclassified Rhodococcus (in: high G+C Gram-positive bacteria)]MBY6414546.1 DUF1295 domain-containing protein [Rhodococcus sp. BP-320]MBY6419545.1 DUF1295 domain-containing protein [Rhodococcus sp. BP-321]MBY6424213.1 DUF1295 domain-containing protein [Rhodococcus sp. BP-324]MBY6429548.1 DUF1295 domain-containing protein [Rhodococcus sp. BP-323]MBY6434387.1 DUF1295 domain-containing protein [Rhodococcus sp. BP-322]
MSRVVSLGRITMAYAVAIAAGYVWLVWGPDTGLLWLDGLIADLIATAIIFVASRLYRNSSVYDAFWSVIPPLLAFYWWLDAGSDVDAVRWWLMMTVMLAWSIRLTGNWIVGFRVLQQEDWRYPLLRARAGRFGPIADLVAIHIFPTLQVFAGLIPVYVVATRAGEPFGVLDVVAFVVGVGALSIETIADLQMRRFVARRSPGQVMDRGLWSWSRHPNYFGEFGVWLSFGLFGLAACPGAWWVLSGAAVMLAMFQGASIPMMEQRSLERRPEYRDVIRRVSRFVPRPPRNVSGRARS